MGVDPNNWTETELRRWLKSVSSQSTLVHFEGTMWRLIKDVWQRNLEASSKMTREELIERVQANLRPERTTGTETVKT
jgi:REP element-mobilizing transposase RayT